jgi:hypothetical protein
VTRDCRDIVITDLADAEAALLECLAWITADRNAFRVLAQQAIHQLHHEAQQLRKLRAQHHRLLDEYRHLRAQLIRRGVAA